MYIDDIQIFTKNEKELEILIQTIWTYRQGIGMQLGIEKCTMVKMKNVPWLRWKVGKAKQRKG